MHFVIFVLLCVLTNRNFKANSARTEDGLELLFKQRSHSDWKDVWHQETHSRCRNKLRRHLYWACEKDIYRITRRNGPTSMKNQTTVRNTDLMNFDDFKWLGKSVANTFLRSRRARPSGPSITSECCTKVGCTWEEYAEYCPSNKRRDHFW